MDDDLKKMLEELDEKMDNVIPFKKGAVIKADKYGALKKVLKMALDQAESGKGKVRHADGMYFEDQPICRIGRRKGHGFTQGQIWKKILEVDNLPTVDAKINEMLSVIVYSAADIILYMEEE